MYKVTSNDLNLLLDSLGEWLDIPTSYFELARSRYHSIGDWLNRDKSSVSSLNPEIFPQGSFRLGTVIKPLSNADEYDIDLVCKLDTDKNELSQQTLKELVGNELELYAESYNMISPIGERRRSWCMNYSERPVRFHLDVLPSIPYDAYSNSHALAITDNKSDTYSIIHPDWPCSNPVGYAEWFKGRMEIRLRALKESLASKYFKSIEEIPDYKVKTPLQRAIQVLKRHRDITFEGDPEDKPVSIILTTLAGHAYNNEENTVEALLNIVEHMDDYIEDRGGVLWVASPVEPFENLADKWGEYPQRKDAFFDWLNQVELDLRALYGNSELSTLTRTLEKSFGENAVKGAINQLGEQSLLKKEATKTYNSAIITKSSEITQFDVPHRQKPRWLIQEKYKASIGGNFTANYGGARPKNLPKDGTPIPKNYSLRFTAITNTPKPYHVYWQVTNTGVDAERARGLRGGFYDSNGLIKRGRRIRNESTLYVGKHCIECFIVINNTCVARSGEFIVNIADINQSL